MGVFDGITEASEGYEGNYIGVGHYRLKIVAVKLTTSSKDDSQFFAIETIVEECLDPMGNPNPHRKGEAVTHLIKNALKKTFLSNVKQFIAAACRCKQSDVTPEHAEQVVSDEQPLAGVVVESRGRLVTTKKGNPFTKVTYMGGIDEGAEAAA